MQFEQAKNWPKQDEKRAKKKKKSCQKISLGVKLSQGNNAGTTKRSVTFYIFPPALHKTSILLEKLFLSNSILFPRFDTATCTEQPGNIH